MSDFFQGQMHYSWFFYGLPFILLVVTYQVWKRQVAVPQKE